MGKYAYLQGSGSTSHFGARMSSYAWLGVVLAMRAGRVGHTASPPTSQHGTLGDFYELMATMATMATLVADLERKSSPREFTWPPWSSTYVCRRYIRTHRRS